MPRNTEPLTGATANMQQQQFQADQLFRRDGQVLPVPTMSDDEPLIGLGDMSLAMRQLFQSPARSVG